jgi:hypothetical protein
MCFKNRRVGQASEHQKLPMRSIYIVQSFEFRVLFLMSHPVYLWNSEQCIRVKKLFVDNPHVKIGVGSRFRIICTAHIHNIYLHIHYEISRGFPGLKETKKNPANQYYHGQGILRNRH